MEETTAVPWFTQSCVILCCLHSRTAFILWLQLCVWSLFIAHSGSDSISLGTVLFSEVRRFLRYILLPPSAAQLCSGYHCCIYSKSEYLFSSLPLLLGTCWVLQEQCSSVVPFFLSLLPMLSFSSVSTGAERAESGEGCFPTASSRFCFSLTAVACRAHCRSSTICLRRASQW